MFAYVATLDVNPHDVDRLLSALLAHRDRCLSQEPGTLQFDVLRPQDSEGTVILYQLYADEDAFQIHQAGESIKQARAETKGMEMILQATQCVRLE